ncbi:MAG: 50S ribosomal protein L10 [Eubacteriales bacterium]|nr:50S ribosomal protein L10 [Eubacteriales bacterium]MDD4541780.1 50S ribosomal protein L10 [Eubacteriales bacterium]
MPSPKILEKKKAQVAKLADELKAAESIVFSDYKGLTVAQDTEMRAKFRKEGVSYQVVKNSLSLRAMQELGIEGIDDVFVGPTAIAYSTEDVVLAPRLIRESSEKYKIMSIKGGVVDGKSVPLEEIIALSYVPSRDVLYGQLAFMLLYPLTALAQVTGQIATKAEEAGVNTIGELIADAAPAEAAEDSAPEVAEEPAAEEAAPEATAEPAAEEAAVEEAAEEPAVEEAAEEAEVKSEEE